MIPSVLIDAMKNTTLLSVSEMCGQKIPLRGIFFPFHQMLPYRKQVSENCDEVLRGRERSLRDGVQLTPYDGTLHGHKC
jgi:hypothetical protein